MDDSQFLVYNFESEFEPKFAPDNYNKGLMEVEQKSSHDIGNIPIQLNSYDKSTSSDEIKVSANSTDDKPKRKRVKMDEQ